MTRHHVPDPSAAASLRTRRESAGITLRACARRMGISAPYLVDLELGRRRISSSILGKFKSALIAK